MWQRHYVLKIYPDYRLKTFATPYDLEGANINTERYEVFLIFNLIALSILVFHNPRVNQLESC